MKEKARQICIELQNHGFQAYFVGGCVRDTILGLEPKDYDVATSASAKEVADIFKYANFVGDVFGVSLVNGIEVASFRSENDYDGRRPNVCSFGATLQDDSDRRDFTFNALYQDPLTGEILDFHYGKEDLANGVVSFIGNARDRIQEDHLRILRAIRFKVMYDFVYDDDTEYALITNERLLSDVTSERIVAEIKKTGGKFSLFVKELDRLGMLGIIFGNVIQLKNVDQSPKWHPEGNAWVHTLRVIDTLASGDFVLNMAGLFHDFGKLMTTEVKENGKIGSAGHEKVSVDLTLPVLKRLKISNTEIEDILWLIKNHMKIKFFLEMKKSKQVVFAKDPRIDQLLDLLLADSMSVKQIKDSTVIITEIRKLQNDVRTFVVPIITGRDLIDLGMKPGSQFKQVLDVLFEIQINDGVTCKEDLLQMVHVVGLDKETDDDC